MKKKSSVPTFTLILSLLFIAMGVTMIAKNLVAVGINSRTLQPSGFGGALLILIGIIFLIVSYFSLSPFSKIRQFFEGKVGKGENNSLPWQFHPLK